MTLFDHLKFNISIEAEQYAAMSEETLKEIGNAYQDAIDSLDLQYLILNTIKENTFPWINWKVSTIDP